MRQLLQHPVKSRDAGVLQPTVSLVHRHEAAHAGFTRRDGAQPKAEDVGNGPAALGHDVGLVTIHVGVEVEAGKPPLGIEIEADLEIRIGENVLG